MDTAPAVAADPSTAETDATAPPQPPQPAAPVTGVPVSQPPTAPVPTPPVTTPAPSNGQADAEEEEEEEPLPEGVCETIYINNLNEKIRLKTMKISLTVLFKVLGPVVSVTVNKNIRMRGQAFVSFESVETAKRAVREVNKFPLYGRPMQITFARTPSEPLVKRQRPGEFDSFHEERLLRKKKGRKDNPLRRKFLAQKEAAKKAVSGVPSGQKRIVQMPEEYLPPNRILFIQNLPDSTTKEELEELFKQYPNLSEVRTIPGRSGIAFVEYYDEESSGVAKEALHNHKLGEDRMKVSFARQ